MRVILALVVLLGLQVPVPAQEEKKHKPRTVGPQADVLRHVQKKYALFRGWTDDGGVRLEINGEVATWPVLPDAELKIDGWWASRGEFKEGDRVWSWLLVDRAKKPRSLLMLCDEPSEQDLHMEPWTVKAIDGDEVVFHVEGREKIPVWKLRRGEVELAVGDTGYVKSQDGSIEQFHAPEEFEKRRQAQRERTHERFRESGLGGSISIAHPLSGEMEVLLDHETMRWARHLRLGTRVSLVADERKTKAEVKFSEPWRERTRVQLVTSSGFDQTAFRGGDRIALLVPEPPGEVLASSYPPDLGQRTGRKERIEWFLASIYCPCGSTPDRCTGMFYTLASCNPNRCELPNQMREQLGKLIDEGLDDRTIFDRIREEHGLDVQQQHLLR